MAVVLYTPSMAIQQVTGISLWVSICLTGCVCTIYTSLGGMKAVVYTGKYSGLIRVRFIREDFLKCLFLCLGFKDMFQVFVMFAGKPSKKPRPIRD